MHQRIAPALEEAGLPLYAQHVGGMDAATLVDIVAPAFAACSRLRFAANCARALLRTR